MASRRGLVIVACITVLTVAACTQGGAAASGTGGASEPSAVGGSSSAPSGAASAPAATPAVTAAASAAASEAPASAGTDATGACALISVSEVSDALGFAATAGEGSGETICIYEVADVGAIVAYVETSTVDPAATIATLKASPDVTPVDGIGDDAYWQPANLSVKLYVLKGAQILSIAVGSLNGVPVDGLPDDISPQELLDMAKKLGTLAVGRM